jgi:Uma2 family endonuclease
MPYPDATTLTENRSEKEHELFRWTRQQYEDLVGAGFIEEGARVELLDGYIVHMPVQNPRHSVAGELSQQALLRIFGDGFHVRSQRPIALDDCSEPEPDIAVVVGRPRDFTLRHPNGAVLIVEVSDTTLAKDRGQKLRAYARNLIPDYWIVNLPDQQIEVYRQPQEDTYRVQQVLHPGDFVSPLAKPDARVPVAELLP